MKIQYKSKILDREVTLRFKSIDKIEEYIQLAKADIVFYKQKVLSREEALRHIFKYLKNVERPDTVGGVIKTIFDSLKKGGR